MRHIFYFLILIFCSAVVNSSHADSLEDLTIASKREKISIEKFSPGCISEAEGLVTVPGFEQSRFFINSPCEPSAKPIVVFVNYIPAADADNAAYLKPGEIIGISRDDPRYIFRYISNKLVSKGFSTLRYDLIGSGCKGKRFSVELSEKYSNSENEFNPFCIRKNELMKISRTNIAELLYLVLTRAHEQKKDSWPADTIFLMISANTIVVHDVIKLNKNLPTGTRYSGIGLTAAWSPGLDDLKWQKIGFAKNKINNCKESEFRRCISEAAAEVEINDPKLANKIKNIIEENSFFKYGERINKINDTMNTYFDNEFMPLLHSFFTSDTAISESNGIKLNTKAFADYIIGDFNLLNFLPKQLYKIKTINSDTDRIIEFDNAKRLWLAAGLREQDFIRMSNIDHDLGTKNILQSNDATQFDKVVKTLLEVAEKMAAELAAEPIATSK